ncbi:unnamed protein product, partial [Ectocarpus sp. 12 AP-2014]
MGTKTVDWGNTIIIACVVNVIERCSRYYFVSVDNSGTFVLVDSSSSWNSSSMPRLIFAGEVTGRASEAPR